MVGDDVKDDVSLTEAQIKRAMMEKDGKWVLYDEQGQRIDGFDYLVMAVPPPAFPFISPDSQEYVESLMYMYSPCYSVLVELEKDNPLRKLEGSPNGLFVNNSECIRWIACNTSKPGRENTEKDWYTIHTNFKWTRENPLELDIQHKIIEEASLALFGERDAIKPVSTVLHHWPFSSTDKDMPIQKNDMPLYNSQGRIGFIGDHLYNKPCIENAWLSGFNIADTISQDILHAAQK